MTQRTWRQCKSDGISLYKEAQFRQAEASFLEAVRRARDDSTDPLEVAEALADLAILYDCVAKFADAHSVLREALSITAKFDTPDSNLLRASCLNTQAHLYLDAEQFESCESTLLAALALLRSSHEAYSIELIINLIGLYTFVRAWIDKAEQSLRQYLELKQQSQKSKIVVFYDPICSWVRVAPGWDDPPRGSECNEEARLQAWAKVAEAHIFRETEQRALACSNEVLKLYEEEENISKNFAANALTVRSELLFLQGDYAGAMNDSKNALRLAQERFGDQHPALIFYMTKAACFGLMVDTKETSTKLFSQMQEILIKHFGEHHPLFARCLVAMSSIIPFILTDQGSLTNTQEALANKALSIAADFYEDNHSLVINAKFMIISLMVREAKFDEADSMLDQVEDDIQSSADPGDLMLSLLDHRISLKAKQWSISDVLAYAAEQEKLMEAQSFRGSGWKVRTLWQIANHYVSVGDFAAGERLLWKAQEFIDPANESQKQAGTGLIAAQLIRTGRAEQAVVLLSKIEHNCQDRQSMTNYAKLAWAYCSCDRAAEAEKAALEIFAAAQNMLPNCLESLLMALGVLLDLYTKQDRLDDAQRILAAMVEKRELSVATEGVVPYSLKVVAEAYAARRSIKAQALYEQAIAAGERVCTRFPNALEDCLKSYINYCMINNQIDKAVACCGRLLELRQSMTGASSTEYAGALLLYAKVMINKDASRADSLCLQALKILEGQTVPSQTNILETLRVRSKILKKQQRYQESLEIDERIAKLKGELEAV